MDGNSLSNAKDVNREIVHFFQNLLFEVNNSQEKKLEEVLKNITQITTEQQNKFLM